MIEYRRLVVNWMCESARLLVSFIFIYIYIRACTELLIARIDAVNRPNNSRLLASHLEQLLALATVPINHDSEFQSNLNCRVDR
jgi:hypothetical protein